MSQHYWKKISAIEISSLIRPHLLPGDECFYARDYISHTGYNGCTTNSDILNFKKAPLVSGQQYRNQAIKKFAEEASLLINCDARDSYPVTAIPSSKLKSDPCYDNRFEDFFNELRSLRSCMRVEWPITIKVSTPSVHTGDGNRDPQEIASNYVYNGFSGPLPEFVLVFDDVLTTGAHFRAYKDFLRRSGYAGEVYGIFWARTQPHEKGP